MAVYLTKKMLSRMNYVQYPSTSYAEDEAGTSGDHWQKLMVDSSKKTVQLAKDMICRVCARNGCTPLSDQVDGCNIMSVMRSITNITIESDDSLPKYICTNCLESLRFALNFKRTCEASDKKFRKILNPTGNPTPSYPYSKHDFQLILHQMKERRLKYEEKRAREQIKKEKLEQKKLAKIKQFTCSPCDITFPNKEKLVAHRRERQCMRRACDICGQLVVSIAQHMRHIHKKSVPHKCPTCGKEFPIIARLKNHMLVHTNTFNFFCDLCPYKCKHKYYLVMHMRTHTGEKPYKCQQCPATFVNPSNLNKHKLTHQAKQFKCTLCEKAFRTNTALREHHEATHMNIKHTCNYCGRDFCYKSDLRKHEIRSHNRMKRDYIGGEPTYKQVERLQKVQENEMDKWRVQEMTITQAVPVVQPTYKQLERLPKVQENEMDKWRVQEMTIAQAVPVVQHTYKQVERLPKVQENEMDKWRVQEMTITQAVPVVQPKAEFITNHALYFSDVSGMLQPQQPQMVQQQTVELTLPELGLKKDEVKLYETQQGMAYF